MAGPYAPAVKNQQLLERISLEDFGTPGAFKATPTIAAGDFKVDIDGAGFNNLGTLPTVSPAGGVAVLITLSAAEMNGDVITVTCIDQTSPKEWADYVFCIQTTALAYGALQPATAGRTLVVDAAGLADANMVKAGPTGAGSAITARDIGASVLLSTGTGTGQLDFTSGVVKANLAQILGTALTETAGQIAAAFKKVFDVAAPVFTALSVNQTGDSFARVGVPVGASISADIAATKALLPTALVGGRMDSSTGAMAANVLTATAINADAITAAKIADGAIDRATFAADTGMQTTRSNTAQAGASGSITLDAGASATADFYKGLIVYLTGGTGSGQGRLITAYNGTSKVATVVPNWATNPDNTSTFALVDYAGADVEAWLGATAPANTGDAFARLGAAGAGLTALGDVRVANLDATVSSRSTYAGGAVASVTAAVTVGTNNDKTGYGLSAAAVQAIWDALTSALTTVGSVGKRIADNLDAAVSSRSTFAGGAVASVTGNVGGNVVGSVGSVTAGVTVTTNNDKTGYGLSAAAVQSIWDTLTSALTTVGSIGKKLTDGITGDIYARLGAPAGGSVSADIAAAKVDTAAIKVQTDKLVFSVANQVDSNVIDWKGATAPAMTGDAFARLGAPAGASVSVDVAAVKADSGAIKTKTDQFVFTLANKVDASIQAAGDFAQGAADKVWSTASRTLTAFGFSVTVGTNNDKTGYALTAAYDPAKTAAQAGDAMTLTAGERTTLSASVWDKLTSAITTVGSIGKLVKDNLDAQVSTRLATSGYTAPLDAAGTRSAVGLASANLDTQLAAVPTANTNADALLDRAAGVETGWTVRQAFRVTLAVLNGLISGAAGPTVTIQNPAGTKNRVVATVDSQGDRTSITNDVS